MKKQITKKQIRKNRLWSLMLAGLGYLTIFIDGDATAFMYLLFFALITFFSTSIEIH